MTTKQIGIAPGCLDIFCEEASQFESIKPQVKEWINTRYESAKTKQVSIYRLKHFFEREIGYITHGALTLWLQEWGYRVVPMNRNLEGTYNHCVYLKARR